MTDPNRKAEKQKLQAEKSARYQAALDELPEFQSFGKISRLNRDITITEKIDGTNGAICIEQVPPDHDGGTGYFRVYAQSRTRIITPENDNYGFAAWVEKNKNELINALGPGTHFGEWWGQGINRGYGLTGRRFSLFNFERWGNDPSVAALAGIGLQVVPVIYHGPWIAVVAGPGVMDSYPRQDENGKITPGILRYAPDVALGILAKRGSLAQPGYKLEEAEPTSRGSFFNWDTGQWWKSGIGPEGIVVFHKAGGVLFKATLEKDEKPKTQQTEEL